MVSPLGGLIAGAGKYSTYPHFFEIDFIDDISYLTYKNYD